MPRRRPPRSHRFHRPRRRPRPKHRRSRALPTDSNRRGRSAPRTREIAEWMRRTYAEAHPGERPFLLVLDFVQLLGGAREKENVDEMVGGAAYDAHQVARDWSAAVLLVSTTSRETRPGGD